VVSTGCRDQTMQLGRIGFSYSFNPLRQLTGGGRFVNIRDRKWPRVAPTRR
jgi:hypothetical protein